MKAIACKPGWYCSGTLETTAFIEGFKPGHVELFTTADKEYPGQGPAGLTDGRKGFTDVFREPSWLGFRDMPLEAGFDFGETPPTVQSLVLSYGRSTGSYIFPPTDVEVWAGPNKNELKWIKALKIEQPLVNEPQRIEALSIPLKNATFRYYKVVARPVAKLPAWHSGKGKKGWIMVDEIFFY